MSFKGASINRAKPNGSRRSVLAAVLCALMFAVRSGAQVPEAAAFIHRVEALQTALNVWQGTLKTRTFGQAQSSGRSLSDRRQCLEWIRVIRTGIARVKKSPSLGQQFSLLSSLTFFENALLNLRDALQLARTMPSTAELATLEQDQEKVEAIRKEFHGFYSDLQSRLFQRLHMVTEGSQGEAGPVSHEPGGISGHIYRADTGKPLADAVVTLESPTSPQGLSRDRVQRTDEDGSYEFSGLSPGNYWVIAYENGFVGSVHSIGTSQNASKGLISVAPGQNRADMDFRLSPSPHITTVSGEALQKALAKEDFSLAYGPGSFSPHEEQFAFAVAGPDPEQVCLYHLASGGLKCVTGQAEWGPSDTKTGAIDYLAWNRGILYAQPVFGGGPFRVTPGGPHTLIPFPVTSPAIQLFGPLPQAVLRAFLRRLEHKAGVAENRQFIVTAWYGQLAMSKPDGQDPYVIATEGRALNSFVLDRKRSVVFYPVPGRYYGAIVSFNLNTRRYQPTPLPFSEGLKLLDVKREGDTALLGYTVDGPCLPKAVATGEDPWILPNKPVPAAQSASLCLATIPVGPSLASIQSR